MTAAGLSATVAVARRGFRLDAALEAAAGETVAVMGPSGAGKSTLLAVVAGLLAPDAGEVRIAERVVTSSARTRDASGGRGRGRGLGRGRRVAVPASRRGVVLLGQDARLFPHLTARENVAFGLRAHGVGRTAARASADEWLWRVGLPGSGGHRPGELSGGQQQRVALARALATSPRVLLLDEPLTFLDTATAAGVRAVLAEQLAPTTAIVVTHDAVDAVALADRLVVLEDGAVTQSGPVREVLAHPATAFVAAAAGLNRVVGAVRSGVWEGGGIRLPAPDAADGPAAAVFGPTRVEAAAVAEPTWTAAIRLAPEPPAGEWIARVERLEPTPSGVGVRTTPADVVVELTLDEAAGLGLAPGMPLRLGVGAAAIRVVPLSG